MFHPLTPEDLPLIWQRQRGLHALSTEFDAFRLNAWLPLDHTEVAYWRDAFALRFRMNAQTCYVAPYETDEMIMLLPLLIQAERERGGECFRFLCVERQCCEFPAGFTATPRRDLYDYLYDAKALIAMAGHDYAKKRNQIAQFRRSYDWRFEPLTSANRDACHQVVAAWYAAHCGDTLALERTAIDRMLSVKQDFGQSGGLLFADGEPVAFAIGSHPRPALLDVIVEKALPAYKGAYSAIIQAYAEHAYSLAPFDYINREEDMGLENLREAKLQLKPVRLIEKTLMTFPL